jgi:hypothetical protein
VGTRYERWLLARGAVFSPSAEAIVALVGKLRKDGWVPDGPAHAVRTVDNTFGDDAKARRAGSTEALPAVLTREWLDAPAREELRIVWPVEGSAAKYPLTRRPAGEARHTFELHRCSEYVYPLAESIDALPTECPCGEDLGFQWDEDEVVPAFRSSGGIFAECEACGRTFDPGKRSAAIRNPFGGAPEQVFGGAAYRFALKVDCGESFVADGSLAFARELVALVDGEFGRDFFEVGSLYEGHAPA